MNKIIILSLLVFLTSNLFAAPPAKDEVTLEQLQQTEHPREKDAPAAFLINDASVEYQMTGDQFLLYVEHHIRVKVYKEEGESYATVSIPLYGDGGVREKTTMIKGFTYNDVGGKVEKVKLAKADIFYEETGEKRRTVKFALPNVRSGSIIDVKYKVSSPYLESIDRFYFQHFIPVERAHYAIGVPEYFNMSPVPKGFVPLSKAKTSDSTKGFGEDTYTFSAANIPSINKDDYVLNVNDYRGSVKYEVSSYQFPGGARKHLSGDWDHVAKALIDHDKIGKFIKDNGKLYDEVIVKAGGTDVEKMAFLYNYVQSNYTWDNRYTKYASQKAKELKSSRTGNVADLNMLLLSLLQKAGVKAEPVLTRYRFSGILNSNFPSPTELNYLLVRATVEGKSILMDATSKYVQLGQLPIRAVNINALVISEEGGTIIPMSNPNVNKRKFMSDYSIDLDEDVVVGVCKGRLADFAAVKFRQSRDDKNEEEDEDNQDLESDEGEDEEDEEIEEVQVENEFEITSMDNVNDLNKAIGFEGVEKNYKMLTRIGKELFIDADLDMGINKNPFTDEKREFPAFYNYKQDWTNVGKLTVPDGYEIQSVPENVSLSLPDNLGKFRYVTAVKGNVITVQYIFKINRDYFLDSEYGGLKQLYNLIITKQKEKIVLMKKS